MLSQSCPATGLRRCCGSAILLLAVWLSAWSSAYAAELFLKEVLPTQTNGMAIFRDSTTAPDGSTFLVGEATGPVSLGESTKIDKEGPYVFLAKLGVAGNWLWAQPVEVFGANGTATCVAVSSNAVYVGGYITLTNLTSLTNADRTNGPQATIAAFTKDGATSWNSIWTNVPEGFAITIPGFSPVPVPQFNSKIFSITPSPDGAHIHIGGTFFRAFGMPGSSPNADVLGFNWSGFLVKADAAAGKQVWCARILSGNGPDPGIRQFNGNAAITATAIDGANTVYVTGILGGFKPRFDVMNSGNNSLYIKKQLHDQGFSNWGIQDHFVGAISGEGLWAYFKSQNPETDRPVPGGYDPVPLGRPIEDYDDHPDDFNYVYTLAWATHALREPKRVWPTDIVYSKGYLFVSGFSGYDRDNQIPLFPGAGGVPGDRGNLIRWKELSQPWAAQFPPGQDVATAAKVGQPTAGFIKRFRAYDGDFTTDFINAGTFNDEPDQRREQIHKLVADQRNVFALGSFAQPILQIGSLSSNLTKTIKTNLLTINNPQRANINFFCVRLSHQLDPLWVRTSSNAEDEFPPDDLRPSVLSYNKAEGRLLFGGYFSNYSPLGGPPLVLGDAPAIKRVPYRGKGLQSFLTAVTMEGPALETVRVAAASRYGPLELNGQRLSTNYWQDTAYKGSLLAVRVPRAIYTTNSIPAEIWTNQPSQINELERDGQTRITCLGYRLENQPVSGPENVYSFPVLQDTEITFDWRTEHALIVTNNFGAGLEITNQSLGNPLPAIGKHWIVENESVIPEVDGVVNDLDPNRFGTRYLPVNYGVGVNGGASSLIAFPDAARLARLRIPQIQVTNPMTLTYLWEQQYRIQVSTSSDKTKLLPFIEPVTPSGPIQQGSRDFWFGKGATIHVGAPGETNNIALKGWLNGDGHFPKIEGTLSDLSVDGINYYLGVTNFSQPMRVTWDFGNRIFRTNLAIGQGLDASGVEILRSPGSGPALAPQPDPTPTQIVDSPPGSTVSDMVEWDAVGKALYPVRPGITLVEWKTTDAEEMIVTQITAGFPGDPVPASTDSFPDADNLRYRHLANSPPVVLDPDPTDSSFLLGLEYAESDGALIGSKQYSATRTGRSVLLFSDARAGEGPATGNRTRETLRVRTVETRNWDRETDPVSTQAIPTPDWTIPWSNRFNSNAATPAMATNLTIPDGGNATQVTAADFDGDGLLDLVTVGASQPVRVFRNGAWSQPTNLLGGNLTAHAVAVGDVEGDGDLDFVVGGETNSPSSGIIRVYLNNGTLDPFNDVVPVDLPVGFEVRALALADIQGKHRLDLIVGGGDSGARLHLFTNRYGAALELPFSTNSSQFGPAVAGVLRGLTIGNVSGDERPELVVLTDQHVLVFNDPAGANLTSTTNFPGGVALALVGRDPSGRWGILTASGSGITHHDLVANTHTNLSTVDASSIAAGDFNSDGVTDLAIVSSAGEAAIQFQSVGSSLVKGPVPAIIGRRLESGFDTAHRHSGYVIPGPLTNALYNASLHNPAGNTAPIIPVNRRVDADRADELVVAWYEKREGIEWPYQPVRYTPEWPDRPGGPGPYPGHLQRIVIAGRLGSESLNWSGQKQTSFDVEAFDSVALYNQPAVDHPGYNPNEEHARLYPSLLNGSAASLPPTAYALRDDLNLSQRLLTSRPDEFSTNQYTSDPYVLVQYRDRRTDQVGMTVYAVERQDPGIGDSRLDALPSAANRSYAFVYKMRAGERVTAPYPLDRVIGLSPCVNSVPDPFALPGNFLPNGTFYRNASEPMPGQRTYWVDHKGEGWAASGDSYLYAHYYYRLQPDFWYPNFDGDLARNVGACIPWLLTTNTLISPDSSDITSGDGVYATNRLHQLFPTEVQYITAWPEEVPTLKVGETLTFAGGENKADNPEAPGLPGVVGWAAGEVLFDSLNPTMATNATAASNFTAWLIAPLEERLAPLPKSKLPLRFEPANGNVEVVGTEYRFKELPPSLKKRLFYDPFRKLDRNDAEGGVLGIRGYLNDRTLGAPDLTATPPPVYVLEPNVLSEYEKDFLRGTSTDPLTETENSPFKALEENDDWTGAVATLFAASRNPAEINFKGNGIEDRYLAGLQPRPVFDGVGSQIPEPEHTNAVQFRGLGPGLALIPNPRYLNPSDTNLLATSYVTLAENNDDTLGAAPVALHIVKVVKDNLYRGAIKTIASDNVFDEKLTLRHTADFGGNVDQLAFSWWYREEDGRWKVYDPLPPTNWTAYVNSNGVDALNQIDLQGANPLLLADNLFFVRYRHKDDHAIDLSATNSKWSDWAGAANSTPRTNEVGKPGFRPQLATGWVKRVFNRLTPYEARFNDFRINESPATYASLIRQAGPPYRGPVALNPDKNVIENIGLIELYRTVLDRATALSINASQPTTTAGVQAALMLATTRISQLYRMLGDEAVSDAYDPTIGFGTSSTEYGKLAPTIFAFQNQTGSLLDEELALLRGLDEDRAWPVHNRLSWNFTRAEGEAAYAMNYAITDSNNDGFLNANDGRIQYPQGHGDAWGHYLSAIRTQYDLIRNPNFEWQTRSELFNQLDVVFPVDYLDERKFADLAAARAAAGAEIVALTYRAHYTENPQGQWQGYTDGQTSRAWGVMEWARRTGQAAFFDWVVANAMLPAYDTNHLATAATNEITSGIQRLDRRSVIEIGKISANLAAIQSTYDLANARLNPLGVDPDVVPFDLDPTFVDVGSTAQIGRPAVQGLTHFEQIYERAYAAVENASVAFDYATEQQRQLRRIGADVEANRKQAIAQDTEYRNRLIEIFGTPYQGAMGAGKPYPAGYAGPDLSLWMYVDVREISDETVPAASENYRTRLVAFKADLERVPVAWRNMVRSEFTGAFDENLVSWTSVSFADESVTPSDDRILELELPATAKGYTFQAPSEWGERAAPGRLQSILSDMMQIEADLTLAVGDYDYLLNSIANTISLIKAKAELANVHSAIGQAQRAYLQDKNNRIQRLTRLAAERNDTADYLSETASAFAEFLPKVVGLSSDPSSSGRGAILLAAAQVASFMRIAATDFELNAAEAEFDKEEFSTGVEMVLQNLGFSYEISEQLKELQQLFVNEGTTRIAAFKIREQLRQKADEFRAVLQEGIRLVNEREVLNQQLAAATQENRYGDFLLRNTRNESLQKYRAAFELASRYTYLAAKAYDYETNFDPNDRLSPRPLLAQITRERTLGQLLDGKPQHRGGLAGVLAALYENFRVIEGQLGFNNPQLEFNTFSLRKEAFGISADPAVNSSWHQTLLHFRKDDLWKELEFQRYCRPFAPRTTNAEPGLVIPFSTEVVSGHNFFGLDLSPGDSAYDPSNFATKIRSLRVNLFGYDTTQLASTPRVYLVPVGLDGMYVPNRSDFKPVLWNVVDQRIPVPVHTGPSDLARPTWLPAVDGLSGTLGEIRRYSSFRAALEEGDPETMIRDTRLVGRSVWNTQWLLIIPGASLLHDPEEGLDHFIGSVTDIQIAFETYGNSGN